MKNKKLIISIISGLVVLIIGIITTVLLINNKNNVDMNKLSSFEYYSGSSSVAIKFYGKRNQNEIDIEFTNFNSGNQNTESFTISTNDFIDLLKTSKIENCKKHTYEYQCGERDGCSHSSLTLKFDNDDKVCYEINSEIVEYFNGYSEIYNEISDDNEDKISQVDWTNLEITLNGKQYKYPFKISDFINNGWTPKTSDDQNILNELVGYIDEETIKYYESIGVSKENITLGHKSATLTQNGMDVFVYADNTITDIKVSDTNVVSLIINSPANADKNHFSFYGVNFGDNKEKIENLFGNKNYEVTSDETNYNYSYSKRLENNLIAQIEFRFKIEKNSLDQISFNFYQN